MEEVDHFRYLGSVLTIDGYCTREIKMRIAMTKEASNRKIQFLTNKIYIKLTKKLVRIKIGITFISRFHLRPIQSVVFVPVGLSSFLHLRQVLLGVQVSSVARLGQLTVWFKITGSLIIKASSLFLKIFSRLEDNLKLLKSFITQF